MVPQNRAIGEDALGREVYDLSATPWWGLDRKEIDWYPTIDSDSCVGCGICFISCGRRVFDWNTDEDKPVVARPYNCMVACQTCANMCPCGAIKFPEISQVKRLLGKAKVVKKAFEIMESVMERENVDERETQIEPGK